MLVVKSDRVIYEFNNDMEGVARVKPGQEFKVMTNDCFYRQIKSEDQIVEEIDFSRVNPATGPIYVEGAEVGDLLKVEILDIEVNDKGVAMTIPKGGSLANQDFQALTKIAEVRDGFVHIYGLKLPVSPMIGVIGVAPAKEDGKWSTAIPWKHGGNMDTREIKKGNTLYFPVNKEGALLALGDLHAIMGDGELCMTGLEINGSVNLKVEVLKGRKSRWPLLESESETMVLASGDDLESAVESGTVEVVNYLSRGLNISFEEAYILSSLVSHVKVSQLVNAKKTVRISIPKEVLSSEKIIENL